MGKPAAVELHTTMDLLGAPPTTVVLTPDTTPEQALLPTPASLQACWLLAARGSLDLPSLQRVGQPGGVLLIRATAGMHPQGVAAFRAAGKRLRSLRHTPLQALHAKLPKRQRGERVVRWQGDESPLCLRRILIWHGWPKRFGSVLTTRAPQRDPLDTLCRASTWRWQVAFLLKEWQSSATLPAFATANAVSVEGVMWVASAAAARKRFLAHMPHRLTAGHMATRRVALGALHVLGDLVEAVQRGDGAGL